MPEQVEPAAAVEPTLTPTPAPPAEKPDEPLGEGGLKALQAERDARALAERRAQEAEAKVKEAEDAKLSDIEKATQAAAAAAAERDALKVSVARLTALATHPVPADYQDLVTGTDEASYLASAKKISDLYARAEGKTPRVDPVPDSGNRSGDNAPAGTSVTTGRDLYKSKHNKNS